MTASPAAARNIDLARARRWRRWPSSLGGGPRTRAQAPMCPRARCCGWCRTTRVTPSTADAHPRSSSLISNGGMVAARAGGGRGWSGGGIGDADLGRGRVSVSSGGGECSRGRGSIRGRGHRGRRSRTGVWRQLEQGRGWPVGDNERDHR
jgi:hypothetical protein